MSNDERKELPDFAMLRQHYKNMPPGQRAELRRVGVPDDLSFTPALYRLFPGTRPNDRHKRVAFFLPWCEQAKGSPPGLGKQLVGKRISEARVLQISRARSPLDLVQFRQLIMHVEPVVNWEKFGRLLWFWELQDKRIIVEDFYIAKFDNPNGGKK